MKRTRKLAGAPHRTASAAWDVLTTLISDTLAASPHITAADVASALAPLKGIGPALVAGGHLGTTPVVLVSDNLHLSITVATDDAALDVIENLNPVPGGGSATTDWTLYLPVPAPLASILATAAKQTGHLSTEPAPDERQAETASAARTGGAINLEALKSLRSPS
ncbi:hypothetical protein [Umezawaea sp. NPDC059074]|uniref:hypothetical protein n=1 Tax=Umezawaea sp. NPDC059074 TaxID=3346716 RepID=UPI00369FB088